MKRYDLTDLTYDISSRGSFCRQASIPALRSRRDSIACPRTAGFGSGHGVVVMRLSLGVASDCPRLAILPGGYDQELTSAALASTAALKYIASSDAAAAKAMASSAKASATPTVWTGGP